jgi:hypothetical protein
LGRMDWVSWEQDTDQWRAVVNTIIILRGLEMLGYCSAAERVLAFQRLSSVETVT